jgi:4-amino-4-deoxy-L-arabinose transferase-like glycosyltransferase
VKKNILVILFLTVYFFALGYKIIHQPTPFYDWDESLYVQTGKEMIEQNKFLMPVWQGNYWLDKPPLIPLIYGAIARLSFSIPPEISTRILSLIIAITVLVLVYVFYQRVIKTPGYQPW